MTCAYCNKRLHREDGVWVDDDFPPYEHCPLSPDGAHATHAIRQRVQVALAELRILAEELA